MQKTGNRTKTYISPQLTTSKKVEGGKTLPNLKELLGYRKKYQSAKEVKSTNISVSGITISKEVRDKGCIGYYAEFGERGIIAILLFVEPIDPLKQRSKSLKPPKYGHISKE